MKFYIRVRPVDPIKISSREIQARNKYEALCKNEYIVPCIVLRCFLAFVCTICAPITRQVNSRVHGPVSHCTGRHHENLSAPAHLTICACVR